MDNDKLIERITQAVNQPIIGNYVFSNEELLEIYRIASAYVAGKVYLYSKEAAALTFVAIVNACHKLNESVSSFYDFIGGNFIPPTSIDRQVIVDLVDNFSYFSNASRIDFGKKYYATVCFHALAPLCSTEAFFKLCWLLFMHDFDYQYVDNDPSLETIYKVLKNKLSGLNDDADDDIKIGSQSYSFQAGLKGMVKTDKKATKYLFNAVLNGIDTLFFQRGNLDKNLYCNILLEQWWANIQEEYGVDQIRKHVKHHDPIVSDFKQIRLKYRYDNRTVFLQIPSIRFPNDFSEEPYYELYSEGKLIEAKTLDLYETSGILVNSKQTEIVSNKFDISNVRLVLYFDGKIILDSEKGLNREFVVFKDGYEIDDDVAPLGVYILYTQKLSEIESRPENVSKITFNTYSFESIEGDVIKANKQSILFVDRTTNKDVHFYVQRNHSAYYLKNGKKYELVDGDLYLNVGKDINIADTGIKYGNERFSLKSFEESAIDLGQIKRFNISCLKDVGETQDVVVFSYRAKKIYCSINFVKFNDIRITYDKDFYFLNDRIHCGFKTKRYKKEFDFVAESNNHKVDFNDGQLLLRPEVITWQIDNGPIISGFKTLFYKEFTNASILSFNTNLDLSCIVSSINMSPRSVPLFGKNAFNLGNIIHSVAYRTSDVVISFQINHEKEVSTEPVEIMRIVFLEKENGNALLFDSVNRIIFWRPEFFIGDKDVFHILNVYSNEEKVLINNELDLNNPVEINVNNIPDGRYTYELKSIERGFLKKERIVIRGTIVLGSKKKALLKDGRIKISSAILKNKSEPVECRTFYLSDFVEVPGAENCLIARPYYIEDMYYKRYWTKAVKNNGKPVFLSLLLVDFKDNHRCIIYYGGTTSRESFKHRFNLTKDRNLSVNAIEGGERTKEIEYFIYEVI